MMETRAGIPSHRLPTVYSRLGMAAALALIWLLVAALCGKDFVRWDNQRLMLLHTAVVGTAAIGATLIIVAGGIDLSVGSTIALTTVVVALCLRSGEGNAVNVEGWAGAVMAAGAGIGCGVACGWCIGLLITGRLVIVIGLLVGGVVGERLFSGMGGVLGIIIGASLVPVQRRLGTLPLSPFIVTLGMWGALRGAAKGIAGNQPVYPDATTWLSGLMSVAPAGLGAVLPVGAWVMLGVAALAAVILRITTFGRHVVAIGSNEPAARLCGVPVDRDKVLVYMFGGACAGVAGCLQFAYLSMGDPTTAEGYELKIIAAVVIGGASLSGGVGGVGGTLIGALMMTVVDNGCTKLGLDNWVQEMVTGGIIVAAVVLDRWRRRRTLT